MATKAQRGFAGLACVKCGEEDQVRLGLETCDTFHCEACGEEWSTEDVRDLIARWTKVVAWVETAPRA